MVACYQFRLHFILLYFVIGGHVCGEIRWSLVGYVDIWPRSGDLLLYYCLYVFFCAGGRSVKRTDHAEIFLEIKE